MSYYKIASNERIRLCKNPSQNNCRQANIFRNQDYVKTSGSLLKGVYRDLCDTLTPSKFPSPAGNEIPLYYKFFLKILNWKIPNTVVPEVQTPLPLNNEKWNPCPYIFFVNSDFLNNWYNDGILAVP